MNGWMDGACVVMYEERGVRVCSQRLSYLLYLLYSTVQYSTYIHSLFRDT